MACFAFRSLLVCLFVTGALHADWEANWHQWRGPLANGVSATAQPPLTWSERANVRWKTEIEGEGGSTPIIWEDKVFVLTAVDTGQADPDLPAPEDQPERPFGITYPNTIHQYVVLCLDRATGKPIWRDVAAERVPVEGHHGDNDFASSSPTTDGRYLYVWFGCAGMFCYDLHGELKWQRSLGDAETRLSFGEASSPVIHDGKLIITRDQENQSYLLVLDADTGTTIWKQERDEPSCWSTPIVVEHAGREQLVTNGHNRVRSYDLQNGELIWECGGQVHNVIPCPVLRGANVICMSGYKGASAMSLPLAARGDITDTNEVAWQVSKGTPYVPSPLLYDEFLYFNAQNTQVMTCLNADSGETVVSQRRLPGLRRIYASPVGAANRVYFVGRDGTTIVLKKGPEFEVLATNRLDENIDSSPALAGDQLFLRGEKFLYCLAEDGGK